MDVDVVGPVIVDVHLNGNGPVVVVGPRRVPPVAPTQRVDHVRGSVPVQVHVDDHGGVHVYDRDHEGFENNAFCDGMNPGVRGGPTAVP